MLGISGAILHDMRYSDTFSDTICALVSCTDEPSWAQECLLKFKTTPGNESLITCVDSSQIYKANKQAHFQALQKQYPFISFKEMMFFDNEMHNVTSVRKLGVHGICCPHGMTEEVWNEALEAYANASSK
jgi:magnesium-dependent phosphatase-1